MKLLKVIKNPVTDHLPVGCRKIGFSYTATKVVNPRELVPLEDPIAVVIGAMAHGKVGTLLLTQFFELFPCLFICVLISISISL